jgi:uncharacterized protein YxjI
VTRYQLRQRLFSLGEDYDIEGADGHNIFHVDGKVFRIRETFVIEDRQGQEVATIKQKLLAFRKTMTIERGGVAFATIRKALFAPFGDKFAIELADGTELQAHGNIFAHEYLIQRGEHTVAEISKRWFAFTDTYGISIAPGEDDGLILAVAVAIDEMAHDPDEAHHGPQGHAI